MKLHLLLVLLLFTFTNTIAQDKNEETTYKLTALSHYGFIMPHHKSISYLVNDQISAIELNLGMIPGNSKSWMSLYKQPEFGIGLYYTSLGNDKILGKATAIFPYIKFPLVRKNKWDFNLQLGIGATYTKKHFHPVKNYANLAIGSKLNAFFKLMTSCSYAIHPKWCVNGGIGFFHISNGSINVPNKGLNAATSNLGLSYYLNNNRPKNKPVQLKHSKLKDEISVVWNNGVKQTTVKDHHKYYKTGLSFCYLKGINAKQKVGIGVDLFYDESANRGKWNFDPPTSFKDRFSQSFFVSHELFIQKFSIIANIGIYTTYKTKPEKPIYTRIGLKYEISKHFLASLSLKAHLGKADYIEWGIGYRIKTKKHEKK